MSVARRADDLVAVEPEERVKKKRRVGPWLPVGSLIIVSTIFVGMIAARGFKITTFVVDLRIFTKVSFLIFMLVFAARPLHDLFRDRTTAWLVANRRYLGLSFAVWHLIHWPILGCIMYIVGPQKFWTLFGGFAIPAGSVLLVISLLAATSNNTSQRVLGKRVWGGIHTAGVYIIWGWFFKVYVLSKMPHVQSPAQKPYIFVYVGILFAAMLLRLAMATRRLARK